MQKRIISNDGKQCGSLLLENSSALPVQLRFIFSITITFKIWCRDYLRHCTNV